MDIHKTCAKDVLITQVLTITEEATVLNAAQIMRKNNVSSLVVERKYKQDAYGMITRKDIVAYLMDEALTEGPLLVQDIMTKPAITVNASLSIYHCFQFMRMLGVRRVPVVDGDDLIGIISNTDLFKCMVE